ncbi:MAG: hypothetical protein U0892_13010 [Pirellulales bacterium]
MRFVRSGEAEPGAVVDVPGVPGCDAVVLGVVAGEPGVPVAGDASILGMAGGGACAEPMRQTGPAVTMLAVVIESKTTLNDAARIHTTRPPLP